MNIQLANFSTDLRRISNWICEGNFNMARDNIKRLKTKYENITSVGVYKNIWDEIEKIEQNKEGHLRSSDRATTLGSILLQESFKE
jgi:hypothetical protein